jgi:membrane protease YdiL (CAAX protease family)
MRTSPALLAADSDTRLRARRGLAIYFAVLVPLSAVFEAMMISGSLSWVSALMWTPAAASVVARLVLREGFGDVSLRLGRRRGWKALGVAVIFPIVLGLIAYGIAWATGLVQFSPRSIGLAAPYVTDTTSPGVVFVINLAVAATIVTVFSVRTAAGEEFGWRGYMLTRLIDAGVPRPILASGLIWGLWHVPLILGGAYLVGPPPALAAVLWTVTATAFSFAFARLRLETGSVWPAVALHRAWNAVIQTAFDPASAGAEALLWVGESGMLVALTMVVAAAVFSYGQWTIRRVPGARPESGAARPAPGQFAAPPVAAVMALALATCGCGSHASKMPGRIAHDPVLPRNLIIPLSTVKEVLPEMSRETATGQDETAVGNPTGTRSVTYATADGSQRVVISVDQYPSPQDASAAYQQAFQLSQEVPGAKGEPVSDLGQRAFIGVATQANETHVGGGALYGDRIVTVTLQAYDGRRENRAKVTALIRKQAAAKRAP